MNISNASEHFIEVNGVNLRYFSWGSESNPKMICLHGHTGQAHIWDKFAQEMSENYHVLAFDQRGHGGSSYAADGYDRDKFVNDLDAIIETLKIDRVTLVGLSMGGWHSILYTSEFHPEKVEKIVIVDIGPESSEEFKKSFEDNGVRVEPKIKFESFEEAFNEARSNNPWVSNENLTQDLNNRLNQNKDGMHEEIGYNFLKNHFIEGVVEPIKNHVRAKKYLARDKSYYRILSNASKISLKLQGGIMNDKEAQKFTSLKFYKDAIILRKYDDDGKIPNIKMKKIDDYRDLITSQLSLQHY